MKVSQGGRLLLLLTMAMTMVGEEEEEKEESYAPCPSSSCGSVGSTCLSRQGEMESRCPRKGEDLWWGTRKEAGWHRIWVTTAASVLLVSPLPHLPFPLRLLTWLLSSLSETSGISFASSRRGRRNRTQASATLRECACSASSVSSLPRLAPTKRPFLAIYWDLPPMPMCLEPQTRVLLEECPWGWYDLPGYMRDALRR